MVLDLLFLKILTDAAQQSDQLKTTITERAFRSKEKYPQVLAGKVIQVINKHVDKKKKGKKGEDEEGENLSHPSLESLMTMQQAARKALDV